VTEQSRAVENAHRLHELACATSNAALLKIRAEFDVRWGVYLKCSVCGARAGLEGCPTHGEVAIYTNRYSWTKRPT